MSAVGTAFLLQYVQLGIGALFAVLVLVQVFGGRTNGGRLLRLGSYSSLVLLLAGVAFGKYYTGQIARQLAPLAKSNPGLAVSGYSAAINLRPGDSNLYAKRGIAHLNLGQYAEAVADFSRALLYAPHNPKYYSYRGFAELTLHDYKSAEADFTEATRLGLNDPLLTMFHALVSDVLGRDKLAVNQYTAAINAGIDSQNRCFAIYDRGVVYIRMNEYKRAIQDFTDAQSMCNELREDSLVNRGNAYSLSGQEAEALSDWGAALKLDPNDPVVFKNRASFYLDHGQLDAALNDLNQYTRLRPRDPYGYRLRAEAYGRSDNDFLADADRRQADRLSILSSGKYIELSESRSDLDVSQFEDVP